MVLVIVSMLVVLFGTLSILSHRPEAIDFGKFFAETGRNMLFTSGLLVVSYYSLLRSGHGKKAIQLVLSAFSYGIIVTYYVNRGILRVVTGKSMPWFLLSKKGNQHRT